MNVDISRQAAAELVSLDSAGNNQLLYFTSSSITHDEKHLFFIGDRTGHPNLFVRDLASGRERMLTSNVEGTLKSYVYFDGNPYQGFGKASVSLDASTGTAYYIQGRNVCSVNPLGETHVLAELPADQMTAFTHVSADGARLCVPTVDARALDGDLKLAGKPEYSIDERVRKEGLNSYLRVYDTKTGREILSEAVPRAWITHVQFCPADPDRILYNHEWPSDCGVRRIWLWDGWRHQPLRSEENGRTRADWVCHEMWERDGSAVIYHGTKDGVNFIGRMRPDGSDIVELPLSGAGTRYGHFTVGEPGQLVSDGYYEQPDDTPRGSGGTWITILKVEWQNRHIQWLPLCRSGSSWNSQDAHPHPIFNSRGNTVYFTSDISGKRDIYRIGAAGVNR